MKTSPNLPEPTFFESKLAPAFQNTLKLMRGMLMLTKKIFML